MKVGAILAKLDLGNSVAEYDLALEKYFVETATFRSLIRDEADIIAGDKGTGKTALFRILQQRYPSLTELADVEVVPAFNPTGNPVFQRLAEGDVLDEGQYVTIWKAFILGLVGNWLLSLYEEAFTDSMFELDALLRRVGLRSADDSPNTVFSQIINLFRRITDPSAVEVAITISAGGLPVIVPRLELRDGEDIETRAEIPHDEALRLLDRALSEVNLSIWLVMDRLDEAFQGFPKSEIPALRALLRTYLDMNEFPHVRAKLFVRKDLFRRIIQGGFVNLTHVNARKIEIVWDEDDLFDLLIRRFRENADFVKDLGVGPGTPQDVFDAVFPQQVDPGKRKPKTWVWMMGRIRDGNGVRPPRNLIDLVQKAQQEQSRREDRSPSEYQGGMAVIGSDALKKGLSRLSAERVNDTLLAEAGDYAPLIEKFRSGKAEHNHETMNALLSDATGSDVNGKIRILAEIGFIESVGSTYKIPMLYRDGLGITQGQAFSEDMREEEEEEEE